MNHKDVRNTFGRIEPYVIPFTAPGVTGAVEKVFDVVARTR